MEEDTPLSGGGSTHVPALKAVHNCLNKNVQSLTTLQALCPWCRLKTDSHLEPNEEFAHCFEVQMNINNLITVFDESIYSISSGSVDDYLAEYNIRDMYIHVCKLAG